MLRLLSVLCYLIVWFIYALLIFIFTFKFTRLNRFSAWPEQSDFIYEYDSGSPSRSYKTPLHYVLRITNTKTVELEKQQREERIEKLRNESNTK